MAGPSTRQELADYCLRKLGAPVININVDDEQLDDRLDDALQFFGDYHFDAVEKLFMKHQLTAEDIQNEFIPIPPSVISVVRVVPLQNTSDSLNMFDVRYQMRLNDLYTFTSTSIIQYDLMMRHLSLLDWEFNPERSITFNRHQGKLKFMINWAQDVQVGQYIIIECYRILDPNDYPLVFNDRYLKAYATALIKRQWGANLIKFQGITLPGSVQLNGESIFNAAEQEIKDLEGQIQNMYELPVDFIMG